MGFGAMSKRETEELTFSDGCIPGFQKLPTIAFFLIPFYSSTTDFTAPFFSLHFQPFLFTVFLNVFEI